MKNQIIEENTWTPFGIFFLSLLGILLNISQVNGQVNFDASGLSGESSNNPTSLQFGPDGRLYVSQQNGNIYAYTVVRNGPNDYDVTNTELITSVKAIPNHNDDGTSSSNNNRQVTGIYLTGSAANPIMYVSSSDPRIGAGGGGNDVGLDTNSGVLSKLECTGGINGSGQCAGWTKVDLVRGFPRSEENHAVNGIQINETTNTLYLAVGGHTNAGAPSNNFAFTTEYALSACVVEIDLTAIEALSTKTDSEGTTYKYNLPTLQNVSKADLLANDDDHPDPWGGDDGLNQAMLDPNGPVQIFATGFRNLYDVVITQSGRIYGVDNGANGGWGGFPEYEESYDVTNNFIPGEPGSTNGGVGGVQVGPDPATYPNFVTLHDGLNGTVASDGLPDDQVNNKNGLHLITKGYYGGHPAPIRANPDGAGLWYNGTFYEPGNANLPASWPPVTVANPVEGDFQNSGVDDGTIANYGPSTNGITEYTASNFDGSLQGYLLVASFNGNIYQVELNPDGTVALNCPANPINNCSISSASFASGFGSQPLDVIAQGDNDVFPGTVWAVTYGANNITVFEPNDFGNCEGTDDDTIDEDGDGYTNADEIANGTNPCSGASQPADFDDVVEFNGFKRSDLNDTDDDNDGIPDVSDAFCFDADNGLGAYGTLPIRLDLFNSEGFGFGSLGFTGIMTNGSQDYFGLVEDAGDELVFGGTAGIYTDPSVGEGDAFTNVNSQKNGFQFPIRVDSNTGPFTILGQINGPYFNGSAPQNFASHGIFMGTGDQDNYVKLTLRNNNGNVAFQIFFESGGSNTNDQLINVPASILSESAIQLFFSVDPGAGTVQAKYATGGGQPIDLGNPITLLGDLLAAVQGSYTINGQASTLAAGTIATSTGNNAPEFAASWDFFEVTIDPSETTAFVEVNTGGINGSTFGNSSFNIENTSTNGASITNVTFDLSSSVLPEVVFDPNGTAGDATSKGFTPNNGTDTTTGVSGHSFTDAYEGGFYGLSIDFNSGQFTQGEILQFGLDIDPVSIKVGSAPGPNESGSVSGLELTGALVTVTFDTGETWEVELFADIAVGDGTSNTIVQNALPAAPSIEMIGIANQSATPDANQTITVTGPVGASVKLLQLEAGLFVEDLDGPNAGVGYNIDPWEINSVIVINELTGTISNSFTADFNVTLTDSDPEAGYNVFAAIVEDSNGVGSLVSNFIIVEFDADLAPSEAIRINAGGTEYTDGNGDIWAADDFFTNGSTFSSGAAITNTEDDALYQTERFNANLAYEIPVSGTGPYQVNLHFAELFFGVADTGGADGGTGSRVFDIIIEGITVTTSFDIFAAAGSLTAIIQEYQNITVNDGNLSISFPASVNNGKISAIEVLSFGDTGGGPGGPIVVTPIPNQINNEGTEATVDVAATGGDGNLVYTAQGLPPGLDLEPTNGDIFGTIVPGAAANSPYNVTITVDDSDGDSGDAQVIIFAWTVNPAVGGVEQVLYRVNAGGPLLAATDGSSPDWDADQGEFGTEGNSTFLTANSTGTSTYAGTAGSAHPGPIITTDPSLAGFPEIPTTIFNTERFDAASNPEMLWQFPVEAGTQVEITLLFAELFGNITAAGQRVFDISVDGVVPPAFDDVDPYAIAGPKGAFVRSFVTTSDGIIDLEFLHDVENPALKGIQITALNFTGNLPPTIAGISTQNSVEGESVNLQVISVDDDNCGSFTYSATNLPPGLAIDSATGLISGTLETGTGGSGGVDGAFIEDGGLVIIESETDFVDTPGGWNLESGTPSFLVASNNNFGNSTGGQVLTYNVQITTPGVYRFHMKSEFQGSNPTEENDTWFKIDNTADVHFFCVEGGALASTEEFEGILGGGGTGKTIYYPAGNAQGRPDHGNENAGSQGFFKIYRSGGGGNKWDGQTIDNNGFPVYAYFPNAGTFSIQMGERSAGHKVDRFALAHIDDVSTGEPTAILDGEESDQVEGGTAGASAGSPYSVQVSVADNCNPPATSVQNFAWVVSAGQTGTGSAFLAVNQGGGLDISTFGNNSFQLQNTGSVDITRLEVESSTGFMFDIVFDPVGTAGDNGAKCLTTGSAGNTAAEVGLTVPGNGGPDDEDCVDVFFNPHNGVNNEEGYDGLALDFTDFNPGELYAFGVDMDPTSIKGDLSTGDSGSVSGFELIGAKVTVFFANGQSYSTSLWDEGSLGGSATTIVENTLVAPIISMVGLTAPTATSIANQNIAITGTPNSEVLLLRVDARLHIDPGNPTVGYDVDPFEANEAMTKELYTVTLDESGNGNIPVTLTKTLGSNDEPDGGLNHFIAVTTDGNGVYSLASNVVVVELDDSLPGVPSALFEITPDGALGASTFSGNSYQLTNNSSGNINITNITIDLSTAILPDMVFDPVGAGGDATASCFTPQTGATDVGVVTPTDPCVDSFSQPRNGGFDILSIDFTDFNPTEFFDFTVDIDPNSIQGVAGAGGAGSVSGYELVGATITITFSDGTTLVSNLYEDGSLGGGQTVVAPSATTAPTISALGIGSGPATVNGLNQTITVSGTVGDHVSLLQMDSRLFIASGDPPFNVSDETYYANEAMSGKTLYTGVIGAGGTLDIPITMLVTDGGSTPSGGLNQFIAVTSTTAYAVDTQVSQTSNVLTLLYDENFVPGDDLTISYGLQGRGGPDQEDLSADMEVAFYPVGSITPTYQFTPTGSATGEIALTGIAPGTYQLAVTTLKYLQVVQEVTVVEGSNTFDVGELLGGDANNDNEVTALDFSALATSFNLSNGDTGYNDSADFNGDGVVTALDFSILATNFNVSGQQPTE